LYSGNFNRINHIILIRETISKDIYIYLEEVLALKRFEFWPHEPMDIEKPSSVSKEYEFIWRLPLHMQQKMYSSWVKNYEVRVDINEVYPIHTQVHYPFHFRYQPADFGHNHTEVTISSIPEVYYDCNSTNLSEFSKANNPEKKFKNLVHEGNAPKPVSALIPNGIKEDLP
jgi:hypothetical protein